MCSHGFLAIPNCKDTASLCEARLFLYAADSLLEDGGHLGWCGLGVGGIAAGEGVDGGGCCSLLLMKVKLAR